MLGFSLVMLDFQLNPLDSWHLCQTVDREFSGLYQWYPQLLCPFYPHHLILIYFNYIQKGYKPTELDFPSLSPATKLHIYFGDFPILVRWFSPVPPPWAHGWAADTWSAGHSPGLPRGSPRRWRPGKFVAQFPGDFPEIPGRCFCCDIPMEFRCQVYGKAPIL